MAAQTSDGDGAAALLSAVALLRDLPEHGRSVDRSARSSRRSTMPTSLVEFSDDRGEAYVRNCLVELRGFEPLTSAVRAPSAGCTAALRFCKV